MTQLPKILKNFTCFIDGIGYAGKVEEIELPKLTAKTQEYIAGGMSAPIEVDMGAVEKLETTMTFAEYDPALYKLFGPLGISVGMSLRGALQAPGSDQAESVVIDLRGRFSQIDSGSWKAGEKGQLKTMVTADYLKITIAGEIVIEIDPVNGKRIVGGTDQLASMRAALNI